MTGTPPPPRPLAGTAPEAVRVAEDAIRPLRYEVAIWFDDQGNEIGRWPGGADVVFTAAELAPMKDTIFTHNHPLGWDYPPTDPRHSGSSFSVEDLALAVAGDVDEIRAVAPIWRFSVKRPVSGWGIRPRQVRQMYAVEKVVAVMELDIARRLGLLTLEEAEATLYHVVVERVVRHLGGIYTRWMG